jgi:hypothetical protein
MVIMMEWIMKYHKDLMAAQFDTEREYIDAMFILIVMKNYGVWLMPNTLYQDDLADQSHLRG